jgi:putative transposase
LNAVLDVEADRLAMRNVTNAAKRDSQSGQYERKLKTKAGEVRLKILKLCQQTFETAIIERSRRRETSVEEALIEVHLAGVSVCRVVPGGRDLARAAQTTFVANSPELALS